MNTVVECQAYSAEPTATGTIRLTIVSSKADALSDKMSLQQIATGLSKSVKQVDKLSRRKKRPLPLIRGNGRPYALRYQLNEWLEGGDPVGSRIKISVTQSALG